jgi:hypothetical protein
MLTLVLAILVVLLCADRLFSGGRLSKLEDRADMLDVSLRHAVTFSVDVLKNRVALLEDKAKAAVKDPAKSIDKEQPASQETTDTAAVTAGSTTN